MGSDQIPILKPEVAMSLPSEPQPAADELSAKLYAETRNAAVRITANGKPSSGFVVDDGHHVVTSARNMVGSNEQFAYGPDGKKYKLELEKLDDLKDLAVLRVMDGSIKGSTTLPIGETQSLNGGDRVWGLSFPQDAQTKIPYLSIGYARSMTTPGLLMESVDPKGAGELSKKIDGFDADSKSEARAYLDKFAINNKLHFEVGSGGGPIFSQDGKVVAMASLSNAKDLRMGQSIAVPAEDINGILLGKGRFQFSYKDVATDWAEKYKADWQDNISKAAVETGAVGLMAGIGYRGAMRFPLAASVGAGAYGFVNLTRDVNQLLQSADKSDLLKYGLASSADLGTIGGAALALAPKLRGYGIALMGLGIAGRAATDFIANHHVVDKTTALQGNPDRPPFNFDTLLSK